MKSKSEIIIEIQRLEKLRDERFEKGQNYESARDMVFALRWVIEK